MPGQILNRVGAGAYEDLRHADRGAGGAALRMAPWALGTDVYRPAPIGQQHTLCSASSSSQ
eukprot:5149790-Alexandrium_andersonii.AAC.1